MPTMSTPGLAQAGQAGLLPATVDSLSSRLSGLGAIPSTKVEVDAVEKALAVHDALVLEGEAATKANVLAAPLDQFRILYFATHAVTGRNNAGMPDAAIVLTPPSPGPINETAVLTTDDIMGLRLNANLVVLSACNTASAAGSSDEALSGLANAFFFAGARALVVSGWPVDSSTTATLMISLFLEIAKIRGGSVAQAWQRTQLYWLSHPSKRYLTHPVFWSAFFVVGDGGQIN